MGTRLKNIGLIGLGMIAGIGASMQFSAIAQKSNTGTPIPYEELRQLTDVFGLIKATYVEPTDDKKLLTDAMSGMVAALDPHSSYLDRKSFAELRESTKGEFVGLGIEVSMEEGAVRVVSPLEDSPAWKAGVKAGDMITRLDSTVIKGITLDEAIRKMRGEPNSKVVLTINRKGEDKPLLITVVRDRVKMQSVKGNVVEPGYGWLRITQFQEPTVKDMVKKLQAIYKEEPNLKGLVLDLRNDPGGVLQGAIGVSAAFLPKDTVVVSTNGQLPENRQIYYGERSKYAPGETEDPLDNLPESVKKIPLVVLVNGGSASASEIVAGALQDHKRATIMGSQTFGKGSVQTILPLEHPKDTALKLTTARYYTPKGRSIQAKGIMPDYLVNERPDGDDSNLRMREADLQKHLSSEGETRAGATGTGTSKDSAKDSAKDSGKQRQELEQELRQAVAAKQRKPLEVGGKDDFQLMQALRFLKGEKVQVATELAKADVKSVAKPDAKAEAKNPVPKK